MAVVTEYEVRYEDKKGRYTEETYETKEGAQARARDLASKGIEAEVWEVERGPERRVDGL